MKKTRLALVGGSGKMGAAIQSTLKSQPDFELVRFLGRSETGAKALSQLEPDFDVMVDFSSPASTLAIAQYCARHSVALVCGTTGLAPRQIRALKMASKSCPVLWAANFSVGIAAMRAALQAIGGLDWDFQVEEIHHQQKKDAPSGTAKVIQRDLIELTKRRLPEVVSIRGGGVFGVHSVLAMGHEEVLTLKHEALSRSTFARGALRAAKWLSEKRKGWYTFEQVLGL